MAWAQGEGGGMGVVVVMEELVEIVSSCKGHGTEVDSVCIGLKSQARQQGCC